MHIYYLRSNPVNPDPRVEKEVGALLSAGNEVSILAWARGPSEDGALLFMVDGARKTIPIKYCRASGRFGGGLKNLWGLFRFQCFLLNELLGRHRVYDAIHAADFDTVLPALLAKFLYEKTVIYDIFDFYADAFNIPLMLRNIVRSLDRWVIGKVDAVILAADSRRRQIGATQQKNIYVVENTPQDICTEHLGRMPSESNDFDINIVYVGVMQPGRLLEEILQSLKQHPRWLLTVAGFGPLETSFQNAANEHRNIRFLGRQTYTEALALAAGASVLFATYDPSIPNHRYSAANKLYEAMMLSKPIIVCNGTGMDELVARARIGYVIQYNIQEWEHCILKIIADPGAAAALGQRGRLLYEERYSWEKMKAILLSAYAEVRSSREDSTA